MRRLVELFLLVPLLAACGHASESAISGFCSSRGGMRGIVNGVTQTIPAIVRLNTPTGGSCTGNVVSDSTVFTAAHCVGSGYISYLGIFTSRVTYSSNGLDLAIAVFDPGTFGQDWTRLLTRAPIPGETIALVGYGQTDFINNGGADGQNRIGCNTLNGFANVTGQTIQMQQAGGNYVVYDSPLSSAGYMPGVESMSGKGDSGGGIFVDGRLIAVTNFGDRLSSLQTRYNIVGNPYQGPDVLIEYDTNLFSTTAVALLRQAQSQNGAYIPDLDSLAAAVQSSGGMQYTSGSYYAPYQQTYQQPYYQPYQQPYYNY